MEKVPQVNIKKCEIKAPEPEKAVDTSNVEQYSSAVNNPELVYNYMQWYYQMLWMRSNFMMAPGFQF